MVVGCNAAHNQLVLKDREQACIFRRFSHSYSDCAGNFVHWQ